MPNHEKWQVDLPVKPLPTPRPHITFSEHLHKPISYYSKAYYQYLADIRNYLIQHALYNELLQKIMLAENGVYAQIFFYTYQQEKSLQNIFQKTAPDIDNLVKGVFDAIFFKQFTDPKTNITYNGLQTEQGKEIRDSRIVAVKAIKLKDPQKNHIHITFQAL